MISGTITDLSGRTLSGPDADRLLALGAPRQPVHDRPQLRARRQRHARASRRSSRGVADTFICAYPNAGLPNEFGQYDETPELMAAQIDELRARRAGQYRRRLLRLDAGAYPRDRRGRGQVQAARRSPSIAPLMRLSGLEPFTLTKDIPFVNVGERTNVTGSAKFRKLITAAISPPRSMSRATRSQTAPRSSTSTWTRA